jgi:PII-like signaling protein
MGAEEVTMVRVYLTEGEHLLNTLLERLHDVEKVRGVTVFRGITGYGRSGKVHSSSLLDLSLDLPVVIEFFDTPEKVDGVLDRLGEILEPGHVVSWPARAVV